MPALARVEQQGTAKRIVFPGLRLEIAQERTRERIPEPGRVGEENKEALFAAMASALSNEASDRVHNNVAEFGEDDDLEGYLVGYAVRQLEVVLTPRILQLRRLVIGEVGRFPELGAALYAGGPGRAIASLAATFERLADRGALSVHDPLLAATQFNWLIMSAPLNRTMLLGDGAIPSSKELREHAREGVRMFLAAYSR